MAVEVVFENHDPCSSRSSGRSRRECPESRGASISGIGQSAIGRRLGRDELDLTIEASLAAIADAGLTSTTSTAWRRTRAECRRQLRWFRRSGHADCAGRAAPVAQLAQRRTRGPAQIQAVINAVMAVSTGLARHVLVYRTVTESTAKGSGGRAGIGVGTEGVGGPMQWSLPFRACSIAFTSRTSRAQCRSCFCSETRRAAFSMLQTTSRRRRRT